MAAACEPMERLEPRVGLAPCHPRRLEPRVAGSWAWVAIALSVSWKWLNPRIFRRPESMDNWASRGVLGERVWLNRDDVPVPQRHRIVPHVLNCVTAIGTVFVVWGLVALTVWPTLLGSCSSTAANFGSSTAWLAIRRLNRAERTLPVVARLMDTKLLSSQGLVLILSDNFLGNSPEWYKLTILAFLVLNPILFAIDGYIAGWILVIEFILTLAMALRRHPLQPGGLFAFEAVVIGMTSPSTVYQETMNAFEVILLLNFMVAGIFFLKNLLLFTFTKLVIHFRSKIVLSLLFSGVAAVLSAFLDALTVTALVITVASEFYGVTTRWPRENISITLLRFID